MRQRALLALTVAGLVALFAVGAIVVFHGSAASSRKGDSVNVALPEPGQVESIQATIPRHPTWSYPIFVARVPGEGVKAFLGRSTHLGCRLGWKDDPSYKSITDSAMIVLKDPCGGSVYSQDGTCVGGPCPRDLDEFKVRLTGDSAVVDVQNLVRGARRHAFTS
jgi:Rieske Fe-S protein